MIEPRLAATVAAGITKWPTWQQAWITTALCLVALFLIERMRRSRFTDFAQPTVRELAVLTGLYGLWRTAKKLPLTQSEGAMERARAIVDFQEALFLPSELSLQNWVIDRDPLGWLSAAYYIAAHVPALFAFLAWMFWRHRDEYGRWRNILSLTTAGCLFIRFVHVAPPRFLTDLGYQDLSEVYDLSVYGPVGTGVSGQFVAMPSIHVAWAGVVGIGIAAASPSRWRWLFAAHLPITVLVVSATGHHWWLDGIVALGLIGLAWLIDEAVRRIWRALVASSDDPTLPDQTPDGTSDGKMAGSELGDEGREQVVVLGERREPGELGDHVVG